MKILITGAGGFLGSNLCNLLSREHKILAVSRKFDNLINNENIQFIKYDLTQYIDLNEKFAYFLPDIVIHCAWEGGNSSKDVNDIWQSNNILSGNNLLKLCSKYKVKHFIGFGSCAEYGDSQKKIDEETICKPINMYGINKFSFRLISERYCQDNKINFSWVRPVFTYGPFDVETRLIPKVIKSFIRNEDLVLNSCSAIVDYLYVEDFCKAIKSIIDLQLFGDYVISSDKQYQVKNVVKQIYQIIKPNSNLFFDNSIVDESPKFICGSSEKLISLSGWSPMVSLDEGLNNTISYFKMFV
jgi:nucleoside-diphosphate-sugar epimerase